MKDLRKAVSKHPGYRVVSKRKVFGKGPIQVLDCDVQVGRKPSLSRQILEHPGSVVIFPQLSPKYFILIRQFRFAVGGWIWEIPAGGIEKNETARQAARRELAEEIGFIPQKLIKLHSIYPTPGISAETMHLFLAQGLCVNKKKGDEDEEIEISCFELDQIGQMIAKGQIADAKTIVGYYAIREHLKKR